MNVVDNAWNMFSGKERDVLDEITRLKNERKLTRQESFHPELPRKSVLKMQEAKALVESSKSSSQAQTKKQVSNYSDNLLNISCWKYLIILNFSIDQKQCSEGKEEEAETSSLSNRRLFDICC